VATVTTLTANDTLGQSYRDEIARASAMQKSDQGLVIGHLKLGEAEPGLSELKLQVANQTDTSQNIELLVKAYAGLGHTNSDQRATYEIAPQTTQILSAEYKLEQLTPFSRVTVTVERLTPGVGLEAEKQQLYRCRSFLGIANPAVTLDFPGLIRQSSKRIDSYYLAGSLAEREINQILANREEAISRIDKLLDAAYVGRIKLFLYPDENRKFQDTGHRGLGWAYGDFIAEVYSNKEKLDPYHELAHILAGQLGHPPAFLDEGFATYVSEAFGWDALKYLGAPGQTVDEVAAELIRTGRSLPLKTLLAVENIGSSPERAEIEYPQSASVVKYLIETYGRRSLGDLVRTLEANTAADSAVTARNLIELQRILGVSTAELESAWTQALINSR
jgi:hypothetical protein